MMHMPNPPLQALREGHLSANESTQALTSQTRPFNQQRAQYVSRMHVKSAQHMKMKNLHSGTDYQPCIKQHDSVQASTMLGLPHQGFSLYPKKSSLCLRAILPPVPHHAGAALHAQLRRPVVSRMMSWTRPPLRSSLPRSSLPRSSLPGQCAHAHL